jgi:hypothetical protein
MAELLPRIPESGRLPGRLETESQQSPLFISRDILDSLNTSSLYIFLTRETKRSEENYTFVKKFYQGPLWVDMASSGQSTGWILA